MHFLLGFPSLFLSPRQVRLSKPESRNQFSREAPDLTAYNSAIGHFNHDDDVDDDDDDDADDDDDDADKGDDDDGYHHHDTFDDEDDAADDDGRLVAGREGAPGMNYDAWATARQPAVEIFKKADH